MCTYIYIDVITHTSKQTCMHAYLPYHTIPYPTLQCSAVHCTALHYKHTLTNTLHTHTHHTNTYRHIRTYIRYIHAHMPREGVYRISALMLSDFIGEVLHHGSHGVRTACMSSKQAALGCRSGSHQRTKPKETVLTRGFCPRAQPPRRLQPPTHP